MKKILLIIFISLVIAGCSRNENNERKALSHCADIKYINYYNTNPQLIVNKTIKSEIWEEIQNREVAVQKWMKENNTTKTLEGPSKAIAKFDDFSDPINLKLYVLFSGIISKASDIQALNEKTMDYKVKYKKEKFLNYAEYHLQCWNEYKKDNGYYTKEFVEKYLKWQKQDISNLGQHSYAFLNEMLKLTMHTSYSKKFREHFAKLSVILPNR